MWYLFFRIVVRAEFFAAIFAQIRIEILVSGSIPYKDSFESVFRFAFTNRFYSYSGPVLTDLKQ